MSICRINEIQEKISRLDDVFFRNPTKENEAKLDMAQQEMIDHIEYRKKKYGLSFTILDR